MMYFLSILLPRRRFLASNSRHFSCPSIFSTYSRGQSEDNPNSPCFKRDFTSTGHACLRDKPKLGFKNFGARFLSSKSCRDGETMEMKVEILSKQNIKPESRTPQHLRTYKFSVLDQLNPRVHMPSIYFYKSNESATPGDITISEKRQSLKQSLSKTLARFFPFAGKVIGNLGIECNDDGVYYVEARVNNHLSEFLNQPSTKLLHQLLPFHPKSGELLSQTYVVMIQVNIFDCGGIAIGIYTTHKIIDGYSRQTFLKAWAATARGSLEQIFPNFISPSLFLPNPTLPEHMSMLVWPSQVKAGNYVTRKFLFDATALALLKAKASPSSFGTSNNPSRVMVVTGLIWKCAVAAFRARLGHGRPSVLTMTTNLRNRTSPALPPYSIGNIYWPAIAGWPESSTDNDVELHSIVQSLKDAIAPINSGFIEGIKGEEGSLKVIEHWKELEKVHSTVEVPHSLTVSSLCNIGLYDADFGWGKPLWVCTGYNDPDIQYVSNLVFLYDTRSGDGIEAWVTLNAEEMAIFEQDTELLAFASMNSSPLES